MRIEKMDVSMLGMSLPCTVYNCGGMGVLAYSVELESDSGPIVGFAYACNKHAGNLVSAVEERKFNALWWGEENWAQMATRAPNFTIYCSTFRCDEKASGNHEGWLGLHLVAVAKGEQPYFIYFSCPEHARSLMLAVSEIGGVLMHRAYAFLSPKGPIGFLFAMECMGAVTVTGIDPVRGKEILWPFEKVSDAINRLEKDVAQFKRTRPEVKVVRHTESEGKMRNVVELCPRCGGLLLPFGEPELQVGRATTVSGSHCEVCGHEGPPFKIRR